MMKIAYFFEYDVFKDSGVLRKVKSHIKYWEEAGNDVKLFIITPPPLKTSNISFLEGGFYYSPIAKYLPEGFIKNFFNKIFSIKQLKKDLNLYQPSIIYYRQGIWYPGIFDIFKKNKVVIELNSYDLEEIKLAGKIKYWIYNLGRNTLINLSCGLISIGNEIASRYSTFDKKIKTIGNGFDFELLPKLKQTNNETINLIFVGTPNQTWHGVDKIFELATHFTNYVFHIVGPDFNGSNDKLENVIYHGYLNKEKLYQLYGQMDFGIGPLAFYRYNRTEGSPLKVREYVAFGLPTIICYDDIDLSCEEYILQIANDEDNIKDSLIIISDFIEVWSQKKISIEDAKNKISFSDKEKKRLQFFKEIISDAI